MVLGGRRKTTRARNSPRERCHPQRQAIAHVASVSAAGARVPAVGRSPHLAPLLATRAERLYGIPRAKGEARIRGRT